MRHTTFAPSIFVLVYVSIFNIAIAQWTETPAPCNFSLNCVAAHSVRVTGSYHPNCLCQCKEGFYGESCQYSNPTVPIGSTLSELTMHCSADGFTWQGAREQCRSQWNGWDIASVPTLMVYDTLHNMTNRSFYIGGQIEEGSDIIRWVAGRLAGERIANRDTQVCLQGFCQWVAGEPSIDESKTVLEMAVDSDNSLEGWKVVSAEQLTMCVACERSPCQSLSSADTFAQKRYFPSCSKSVSTSSSITHSLLIVTETNLRFPTQSQTASTTPSESIAQLHTLTQSSTPISSNTRTVVVSPTVSASPSESSSLSFSTVITQTRSLRPSLSLSRTITLILTATDSITMHLTPTISIPESDTQTSTRSKNITLTPPYSYPPTSSPSGPTPSWSRKESISWTYSSTISGTSSLSPSISRLFTSTPSLQLTATESHSFIPTQSASPTEPTHTTPLTATVPITNSSSQSLSKATLSQFLSLTASGPLTRSFTSPQTSSATSSNSLPQTLTFSVQSTPSGSETLSLSLENTRSCLDIPLEIANNTCGFMWPLLGVSYSSSNRQWCEHIEVPFAQWGGRRGSTFDITFAVNKSLALLDESFTQPPFVSGPFRTVNVWISKPNNTLTVQITYRGHNTITTPGPFHIYFSKALLKCPLPAEFHFIVMPLRSEKASFGVAAETIQQIAGTISLIMAMPAVAAQMGMLSALQDLTRCEVSDLSNKLDFMNNPLGMSVGARWGAPQRGVFIGTTVSVAAFTIFLFLLSYGKLWLVRVRGKQLGEPWPPTYLQQLRSVGLPGIYLLIAAFLMDSTVTAGVSLIIFGKAVSDRVLGTVFTALGYGYVMSIFWITLKQNVAISKDADGSSSMKKTINPISKTTRSKATRWFLPSSYLKGSSQFDARYGAYVTDLRRVRCYRGIELLAVCIVSTLQAAAFGHELVCVIELSIALLCLTCLFFLVCWMRPMAIRFEYLCTVVCLGTQVITTSIMISNVYVQETLLEMLSLLFVLIGTVVTLLQVLVSMLTAAYLAGVVVRRDYMGIIDEVRRYRARGAEYYEPVAPSLDEPLLSIDEQEDCALLPLLYSNSLEVEMVMRQPKTLEYAKDEVSEEPRNNVVFSPLLVPFDDEEFNRLLTSSSPYPSNNASFITIGSTGATEPMPEDTYHLLVRGHVRPRSEMINDMLDNLELEVASRNLQPWLSSGASKVTHNDATVSEGVRRKGAAHAAPSTFPLQSPPDEVELNAIIDRAAKADSQRQQIITLLADDYRARYRSRDMEFLATSSNSNSQPTTNKYSIL